MSASQHKKRRQDVYTTEMDRLAEEKAAAEKKTKLKRVRNIIIAVVVVLVIAAIFVINSNLFYTGMTAVTVDGVGYTAAEVNYLFNMSYYSFVQQQEQYASSFGLSASDYLPMIGLDTSKPLSEQAYPDDSGMTWRDYFRDLTMESLKQLTALNKAAEQAGYVLPQSDEDDIAESVELLDSYAVMYNYKNVEQYLASQYGKGVTKDTVAKMVRLSTIATKYSAEKQESFAYEESALESWYQENKDTYDNVTYCMYFVSGAVDAEIEEPTDAQKADALAAAKEKAETLAKSITDEASFVEAILSADAAAGTTGRTTSAGQSLSSSVYGDWLLDGARKEGDVTTVDDTNGTYILLFLSRDDNHYAMRQARHILVKAEADADGVYTDEAKAAAKEQAEAYLQEWKDGEATEDSFAAMANEYSDDTGSNTTGGLYDEIMKGAYVEEFENFVFDESRKPGDTGVVYGEAEGSYAGYHVMYYVGEGQLYSSYIAETMLRSEDYTAWENGVVESAEAETGYTFRYVGRR